MTRFTILAALVLVQYSTTPTITGRPQYGTDTRTPDGSIYHTAPNVFGHPEYGTSTTGPGVRCITRDVIIGRPSYGQRTECR